MNNAKNDTRNGIGEIYDFYARPGQKRSAVITGAGSGLGRDIALGLAAKSYRVFGTAISSDEIADLKKGVWWGEVEIWSQCDITNERPPSRRGRGEVITSQNEGRIDLLISNAGILHFARAAGGSAA